jgi:hypothetical protein
VPTLAPLFKRSFRLAVDTLEFGSKNEVRPLTFSFNVERDNTRVPNNASVILTNLSADTRADLEERNKTNQGTTVRIEAGYGTDLSTIFFGALRRVASWRQGPNWLTEISGGDGEKEIATARISRSFVKGTPVSTVLKEIVRALGVNAGNLATLSATGFDAGGTTLRKALTVHGDAAGELECLCASMGLRWSIQDGTFYAARTGEAAVPGFGPVFSPETGLIETPQVDKDGRVSGTSLLSGDLIPGKVFRVESSRISGDFICERTVHYGESNGGSWYVDWTGAPKGARPRSSR